ncbi:pseudouridylate synthase [Ligilactobacillus ruminis]|nr:pseudouridylate synthase [Ligilactobacillus ruminis]
MRCLYNEKESRFFLEWNEMTNKVGHLATDFVRHFLNFGT